jgi:hypothetical protein
MRKEKIQFIGLVLVFVVIAVVIIQFDNIVAWLGALMAEQMDSMLEQVLR